MPSERGCVEIYGVFTNNHVLGSINEAEKAHATFGYEGSEEGQQVKLKPEKMFRTNKVSSACACDTMRRPILQWSFLGNFKIWRLDVPFSSLF